ncbi:hypothetical protein F4678DRAFT_478840 [Xylaria arbuscula]|nr:hypothetical protein F4678DRAFT_478840 [Xylaria arbuscula]
MPTLFCCSNITTCRFGRSPPNDKIMEFMGWFAFPRGMPPKANTNGLHAEFVVKLIRRNRCSQPELIGYFAKVKDSKQPFVEVDRSYMIGAHLIQVNPPEFFECREHARFMMHTYEQKPLNVLSSNKNPPGRRVDL